MPQMSLMVPESLEELLLELMGPEPTGWRREWPSGRDGYYAPPVQCSAVLCSAPPVHFHLP
jgi:hypothetical protein